jgi:hypothetical protein
MTIAVSRRLAVSERAEAEPRDVAEEPACVNR